MDLYITAGQQLQECVVTEEANRCFAQNEGTNEKALLVGFSESTFLTARLCG
jgi:hypothetical protein